MLFSRKWRACICSGNASRYSFPVSLSVSLHSSPSLPPSLLPPSSLLPSPPPSPQDNVTSSFDLLKREAHDWMTMKLRQLRSLVCEGEGVVGRMVRFVEGFPEGKLMGLGAEEVEELLKETDMLVAEEVHTSHTSHMSHFTLHISHTSHIITHHTYCTHRID